MEPYILNRSFKFVGVDMFEKFGVRLREMPSDVLIPNLRSRKKRIPSRSGEYDYGAKYYDERQITLHCIIDPKFAFNDEALREIAYVLGEKGQLRLWNCPDKYYIGRVYDAVDIQQELKITTEFDLVFVCDPFAYGNTVQRNFVSRLETSTPDTMYKGTAPTPLRVEITNKNSIAAKSVQIQLVTKSSI